MTPALPRVSGRQVVVALTRLGFEQVGTKGSHAKLRHPETRRVVIVPLHRELAPGTLRSILRQAAVTANALLAAL